MAEIDTFDRYNQLRQSSCVCLKARRIDLVCCCKNSECETFPLACPSLTTFICAMTFGWIKIGCTRKIPNSNTYMEWTCCKIRQENTCILCFIGILHTICCAPIFIFSLISLIGGFLIIDVPFYLFWCMTCACFGKMWPLKYVYINQLNNYHENDEPPVVVQEQYTVKTNMNGVTTYSDKPFSETYWGRGRPCTCNLCLLCSCYQDLHGIDAHEEEKDKSYEWYIPKFVKGTNSEYPEKSRIRIL